MKKVWFQPIKVERVSEVIESRIKALILDGDIKPGDRLPTERELSAQFGVSVVTVREALRGLETFGVIRKQRGRGGGIVVTEIQSSSVKKPLHSFLSTKRCSAKDLGELRKIIEPSAIVIAASNMTPEELEALEGNIIYCEDKVRRAGRVLSREDFLDIEERNVEFHRLIAEATHNPVLALTVDYVMDFLLEWKKTIVTPDVQYPVKALQGHRKIYTCLERGDIQRGQREMLSHIEWAEEYFASRETDAENAKADKEK